MTTYPKIGYTPELPERVRLRNEIRACIQNRNAAAKEEARRPAAQYPNAVAYWHDRAVSAICRYRGYLLALKPKPTSYEYHADKLRDGSELDKLKSNFYFSMRNYRSCRIEKETPRLTGYWRQEALSALQALRENIRQQQTPADTLSARASALQKDGEAMSDYGDAKHQRGTFGIQL